MHQLIYQTYTLNLTIVKQRPRAINLKDETTYNEIAYLRKIANKEVEITPIDFTFELTSFNAMKPEIWCLIGNPGCGKTFLAKRTALRFSSNELPGIQYSISVPCRNTDWHSMECTLYENESEIETVYISKWLCLGLPKGPNWAKDFAKHLTESDGEGLMLIVDGLDEFTRKVPFGKTFLHSLLTRESLTKSTINSHKSTRCMDRHIFFSRTQDRPLLSGAGILARKQRPLFPKTNHK